MRGRIKSKGCPIFLLLLLILLVVMMVHSALGNDQDQVDLSAYQWESRLLVLFSPSEDDPVYQSFKEQLQGRTQEVHDRDLLTFHVFETGESRIAHLQLNEGQVLFLRKKFSIMPGQRVVILIGKDGGVKFRGALPVELSDIFSIIDAMPMRQREMRERSK